MQALGFIETTGFVAAVEAADSALKAANVSLVTQMRAGSGLVMVIITGDVAAVKAGVDAAAGSASQVGEVAAAQVIASPHAEMAKFFGIEDKPDDAEEKTEEKTSGPAKAAPKTSTRRKNPGV